MVWILLLVGLFIRVCCCSKRSRRVCLLFWKKGRGRVKSESKIRECLRRLACLSQSQSQPLSHQSEFWKLAEHSEDLFRVLFSSPSVRVAHKFSKAVLITTLWYSSPSSSPKQDEMRPPRPAKERPLVALPSQRGCSLESKFQQQTALSCFTPGSFYCYDFCPLTWCPHPHFHTTDNSLVRW